MTVTEVSCSVSTALTVRYQPFGDGPGFVLAKVERNNVLHPVQLTFDSDEDWWTEVGYPSPSFFYADAWSLGTHEIGHVFGVDHSCYACATPQNEYVVMNGFVRAYDSDPDINTEMRDLTSDDEAGLHWVKNHSLTSHASFCLRVRGNQGVRTDGPVTR